MFTVTGGVDYLFGGNNQIRKLPIMIIVIGLFIMITSLVILFLQIKQGSDSLFAFLNKLVFVISTITVAIGVIMILPNSVN